MAAIIPRREPTIVPKINAWNPSWKEGPTLEKIKFATVELYWKDCPKSKRNRPVI